MCLSFIPELEFPVNIISTNVAFRMKEIRRIARLILKPKNQA